MRAVVCRSFDDAGAPGVEEIAPPACGPGCVRIGVHVAGVGFATALMLAGRHQNRAEPPFVPGTEIAGVVLECGPGVEDFAVGDRVAAGVRSGGFAEQAVAPRRTVYRLPERVDFAQAVHFPTLYATAWAGLDWRARLQPGETVLVLGAAGGTGMAALEVARCIGARVIAVASTAAKREAALRHGASLAIDPSAGPLAQAVLAATAGRGADVVFDPVGGEAFAQAMRCVAPEGRLISAGFASGTIPSVQANLLLVKNVSLIGLYWGYYADWGRVAAAPGVEARARAAMETMLQWCASGRLSPQTWRSYPLERLPEALAAIASREVIGRVVLELVPQASAAAPAGPLQAPSGGE